MTPQPSALAALQRYDLLGGPGDAYIAPYGGIGKYLLYEDVEKWAAAWPAQGEAVAFRKRYSDRTFTAWMDIALWSPGDKVVEYAYTHPSPSTAALREALRECADDLEAEINGRLPEDLRNQYERFQREYKRDMDPVERARTLLEGDKT